LKSTQRSHFAIDQFADFCSHCYVRVHLKTFAKNLACVVTAILLTACSSSGDDLGGAPILPPLGTDASLSSLSITGATLDPVFSPSATSYTAMVPQSADIAEVFASTNDSNATVSINSGASASVPLAVGDNTITIVVTAEDRIATRTYSVVVTRLNFAQEAYIKASNTDADPAFAEDFFGLAVAISADGSTVAIGAPREDSLATGVNGDETDNSAQFAGAVYVFTRSTGGAWTQQAYLKASNTDADPAFAEDFFGLAVAISADGSTLAVGAPREASVATGVNGDQTDNSARFAGAVYVFTRDTGGVWTQQAYVKASNTDATDFFGRSVALSADGDTMAVGAFLENGGATGINGNQFDNTVFDSGAAYVFTRDGGGTWSQQAYVKASNTGTEDRFGFRVALSADGATLAVSAQDEDSAATGVNGDEMDNSAVDAGAAYVFTRDTGGVWTQQAYIKAANTEAADNFGMSADLSSDGNTLLVGAFFEDSGDAGNELDNSVIDSGAAYVFTRDGGGTWLQQAYIKASSLDENDHMGWDASLAGDASKFAISVHHEDSAATGVDGDQSDNSADGAGAALVFSQDSAGAWVQQAYIKASNTDLIDNFGVSVALSEDGNLLAVGAHREDSAAIGVDSDQADNSAESAGALYVFQ
jgi:hypothetical protein